MSLRSGLGVSLSSLCLLTGCAISSGPAAPSSVASAGISGTIFGGQQPVKQSLVTVWQVGTADYGTAATSLATTTSDNGGRFAFAASAYNCPTATTQVYITAKGGDAGSGTNPALLFAAGLGNCSTAKNQTVDINEVTTVATAFAMSGFFTTTLGASSTDSFASPVDATDFVGGAIGIANTNTIPTLVSLPYGTVMPNTATITIDAAKINTIANTLAACANSSGTTTGCTTLFTDTTPPGGTTAPSNTLEAAVQMALYPYQNVTALYQLGTAKPPFAGLSTAPNDWTIAVAYKTTTLGLGIVGSDIAGGTSSNIDIDTSGRVWVPSNKPGAQGVAYFDPTTNTFSAPFGGTNLVQPQYLAIDQEGIVWVTDQLSGYLVGVDSSNPTGTPSSGNLTGLKGGPIADDPDDSIFYAVEDTQAPVLAQLSADRSAINEVDNFTNTPTSMSPIYNAPEYLEIAMTNGINTVCDTEVDETQSGTWYFGDFGSPGTISPCTSGGSAVAYAESDVIGTAPGTNQLCSAVSSTTAGCFAPAVALNLPQGIATDGLGKEWVANSGNGSISTLYGVDQSGGGADYLESSPVAYLHGTNYGNTMTKPYGLAIDGSGNVWVANAGCVSATTTPCSPTSLTLTELVGAAAPTITPLSLQYGGYYAGSLPEIAKSGRGALAASRRPATRLMKSHSGIVRGTHLLGRAPVAVTR